MSDTLKRFNETKRKVEDKRRELDRAAGALQESMANLHQTFGCRTLKEAKAKLEKLRTKTKAAEKDFNDGLDKFERKWGKALSTAKSES